MPNQLRAGMLFAAVVAALGGCQRAGPAPVPTRPVEVVVASPVLRQVRDFEDFSGRTEAVDTVLIKARVSGYLTTIGFADGTDITPEDVAAKKLLFEIDPRPYQAAVRQAVAQVAQARTHLERVTRDYNRFLAAGAAVSREEMDKAIGDKAEAEAAVEVAEAAKHMADINLDFTRITAPMPGRLGRRLVDVQNLVRADDTPLVSLVKLDPIYVAFDIDERTVLRVRRLIQEGKVPSARRSKVTVQVGLSDEEGFSRTGDIDFVDNRIDPNTGTLRVRAALSNSDFVLSPGLFVRVRLPIGPAREALVVPEEALGSDQGQRFLWVVNDQDEVEYRRVRIGRQEDGWRVIEEGVTTGDRVVVSGMQRVRLGSKVNVQRPAPAGPSTPATNGEGPTTAGATRPTPPTPTESPAGPTRR
ncbi:MAG TPA: efflux RND transporter periplasmic adaptor subunit [Gemmatales bacterium]|nr:efflux RND transporter periplasmic adaptor subunit [Gemmatales bacterium]HMP58105.1 efflux RND transporter periplasmic adaptor subunit [Gemmatales bacterium]